METKTEHTTFDGSESALLRIVCSIDVAMMIGNLIFALYITTKLLIPLKIKGSYIIAFYALSVFMTLMRIAEVGYCIYKPST